jgi:hypothetical protein
MADDTNSGDIKVVFSQKSEHLWLRCNQPAFDRLRHAILREASVTDLEATAIQFIEISREPNPELRPFKKLVRDKIALVGCALISVALSFLFIAGRHSIWRMFKE